MTEKIDGFFPDKFYTPRGINLFILYTMTTNAYKATKLNAYKQGWSILTSILWQLSPTDSKARHSKFPMRDPL